MIIPLMLFGGLFLNNGSVPDYLIWVRYISWFYYANEALTINQWIGLDGVTMECPSTLWYSQDPEYCPITGEQILDGLNFEKENLWFDIGMLAVLAVVFRILSFLALFSKTYRNK